MIASYSELLERKKGLAGNRPTTIECNPHPNAKPHQAHCLNRLLRMQRGAAFLDTGLGKTFLQLDWARHIPGEVLILAPLAVAQQTADEAGELLGMNVGVSRDGSVKERVTIANYERAHLFDTSRFAGIVLDESSILKGQTSKTRAWLTETFAATPYRLACTATPSPNDHTELGNHSDFLGVMNSQEMLTRWFIHDSMNTADWRLKGHAVESFWEWVGSWAACVTLPSDLGFEDEGYALPPLTTETHVCRTPTQFNSAEELFSLPSVSATDLHGTKKLTLEDRCKGVAGMVNGSSEPWIVWCESNEESDLLTKMIPDAVEVKGSQTIDQKEARLAAFTKGQARVIISKPKICGFGMNWQHCSNMAFASISYSYESFYQAVRRVWRFGQKSAVNIHVFISDAELPVWREIERKAADHQTMKDHMKMAIGTYRMSETKQEYRPPTYIELPTWITERKSA